MFDQGCWARMAFFLYFFHPCITANFLAVLYNCVASVTDSGVVGFVSFYDHPASHHLGSGLSFLLKNHKMPSPFAVIRVYEVIKTTKKERYRSNIFMKVWGGTAVLV